MIMCKVEGCNNKVLAKGYCSKHYTQLRKHGRILERTNADPNEIIKYEDYAEIILYDKNQKECGRALIDLEDIDKIKDIKWHKSEKQRSTFYCINSKFGRLHRFILDITDKNIFVDHINHNGLDNRKSNLRTCCNAENICNCHTPKNNKSGCKGVYYCKERGKWAAQVTINNKTKSLGRFDTYEEAVKVRLKAEKEYYGEFAYNENNKEST